jgi:hypothetical protein
MAAVVIWLALLALCGCADALRLVPALRPATGLTGRALATMTMVQETETVSFVQTEMRGQALRAPGPCALVDVSPALCLQLKPCSYS